MVVTRGKCWIILARSGKGCKKLCGKLYSDVDGSTFWVFSVHYWHPRLEFSVCACVGEELNNWLR